MHNWEGFAKQRIERAAIYLFRESHLWDSAHRWEDLDDYERGRWLSQARGLAVIFEAYSLEFLGGYQTKLINYLCPCPSGPDHAGPERECPVHGDLEMVLPRLAKAHAAIDWTED